jgi:hypothetical protein
VPRVRWLALALPVLLLAACGNSRTPVPSLTQPLAPDGFRPLVYSHAGIGFYAPRNWTTTAQKLPLVATVSSGAAIIAVWRYPRRTPAPSTFAQLAQARQALVHSARAADRTLRVINSRLTTLDGSPAIVLNAFESVGGLPRRVRSIHVFRPAAELVLDEYAPSSIFGSIDRTVFIPLRHSVRLFP